MPLLKTKAKPPGKKTFKPKPKKTNNKLAMDKVKIKRVRKNKKKATTKEKVLAGLGLGSTLLGGISSIAPKPRSTQFVRTQASQDTTAKSGKVKEALNKIFGAQRAQASDGLEEWRSQATADLEAGYFGEPGSAGYEERKNAINDAYAEARQEIGAPSGETPQEEAARATADLNAGYFGSAGSEGYEQRQQEIQNTYQTHVQQSVPTDEDERDENSKESSGSSEASNVSTESQGDRSYQVGTVGGQQYAVETGTDGVTRAYDSSGQEVGEGAESIVSAFRNSGGLGDDTPGSGPVQPQVPAQVTINNPHTESQGYGVETRTYTVAEVPGMGTVALDYSSGTPRFYDSSGRELSLSAEDNARLEESFRLRVSGGIPGSTALPDANQNPSQNPNPASPAVTSADLQNLETYLTDQGKAAYVGGNLNTVVYWASDGRLVDASGNPITGLTDSERIMITNAISTAHAVNYDQWVTSHPTLTLTPENAATTPFGVPGAGVEDINRISGQLQSQLPQLVQDGVKSGSALAYTLGLGDGKDVMTGGSLPNGTIMLATDGYQYMLNEGLWYRHSAPAVQAPQPTQTPSQAATPPGPSTTVNLTSGTGAAAVNLQVTPSSNGSLTVSFQNPTDPSSTVTKTFASEAELRAYVSSINFGTAPEFAGVSQDFRNNAVSALANLSGQFSRFTTGAVLAHPEKLNSQAVFGDAQGNRIMHSAETGGYMVYDNARGVLYLDKGNGEVIQLTGNPDYNQGSVAGWTNLLRGAAAGTSVDYNLLTDLGGIRNAQGLVTGNPRYQAGGRLQGAPLEHQGTIGTSYSFDHYGSQQGGQDFRTLYARAAQGGRYTAQYRTDNGVVNTVTINVKDANGNPVTRTFDSPQDLVEFLARGTQDFYNMSAADRAVFVAANDFRVSNGRFPNVETPGTQIMPPPLGIVVMNPLGSANTGSASNPVNPDGRFLSPGQAAAALAAFQRQNPGGGVIVDQSWNTGQNPFSFNYGDDAARPYRMVANGTQYEVSMNLDGTFKFNPLGPVEGQPSLVTDPNKLYVGPQMNEAGSANVAPQNPWSAMGNAHNIGSGDEWTPNNSTSGQLPANFSGSANGTGAGTGGGGTGASQSDPTQDPNYYVPPQGWQGNVTLPGQNNRNGVGSQNLNTSAASTVTISITSLSITSITTAQAQAGVNVTLRGSGFQAGDVVYVQSLGATSPVTLTITGGQVTAAGLTVNVRGNLQPGSYSVRVRRFGSHIVDSNTQMLTVTALATSGGGIGAGGGAGGAGSDTEVKAEIKSDSQNEHIAELRQHIRELQAKIDTLTHQVNNNRGGGTTIVHSNQQEVQQLRMEVQRLTNLMSQSQNNQLRAMGSGDVNSPTGATIPWGLQMPSGASSGLQMPPGYPASEGYVAPQVQGAASAGTYTVKKGDTLWNIAKKYYGDGRQWRKILEANTSQVKNPRTLRVGTVLVIPQ